MRKQIKFPTIIGLVLLIIGVVAGVFLIQSDKIFTLQASPEEIPQQVRITNITDKSFTVSWITDKPTEGFVAFGKSATLGTTVRQQSPGASSLVHHAVIENINPQTTYFFKVGSGSKLYDNNGQLYQTKTAPEISIRAPNPDVVFGNVNDSSGKPITQAVVYVNVLGTTPQSVLIDTTGKWSLPLSTARNTNLSSFASYSQDSILEIFVQAGNAIATAKIKAGAAHPVPTITLGQNHDFTNVSTLPRGGLPTSQINLPSSSTTGRESGFEVGEGGNQTSAKTVTLTSISENESINTNKPSFSGTGSVGLSFTIKVESPTTYTDTVTIDSKGKWSWALPGTLDPGSHTATITWKDDNGLTRVLTRKFTVLATGSSELPAFTATASGSTTPATGSAVIASPSATPKATATPKPSATPTPTSSSSARVSYPATTSGVPQSGYLTPSIAIFIMGMILIFVGILFPKFKRQ